MTEKEQLSDSTASIGSFGEIVYGSGPGSTGGSAADESRVMSERVQSLAASIYKEFEKMIQKHDEGCVKELMPLVVNVLESLDMAYLEKEEHEVELELLKEDNEQLVTQYEREKQLRRGTEQRFLEYEDHFEGSQKEMQDKVESLESIVRMLELKAKNSADHVVRLEEREGEAKQEFSKLHERYTELFKTHMDYMERTKFLMGNEKFDVMNASTTSNTAGIRSKLNLSNLEPGGANTGLRQIADLSFVPGKVLPQVEVQSSMTSEMQDWPDDVFSRGEHTDSSSRDLTPRLHPQQSVAASVQREISQSELSTEDSLGADLTGDGIVYDMTWSTSSGEDEADQATTSSQNGMGKEVENLIKENTELLETKNALNIVKNDLIAKIDELASEQEILREEIRSLETIRAKLNERIKELEIELKEAKHQLDESAKNKEDEEGVPMAQRKRFTRVEMARVLMERNQYKEKLMELQEAIRWTEMIRASRNDPSLRRKKSSIWEFFSGLFSSNTPTNQQGYGSADLDSISETPSNGSPNNGQKKLTGGSDPVTRKKPEKPNTIDFLDADYYSERRANERREQYKLVKAHVKKDESGRLQAYGWSIPAAGANQGPVPVPIHSKPLMDQEPNLRIWCATGIILNGGKKTDGTIIDTSDLITANKGDKNTAAGDKNFATFNLEPACTSLMWICSSAHGQSQVSVIDANNPSEILDSFTACSSHLLCIESVPGLTSKDYVNNEISSSLLRPGKEMPEAETGLAVGETIYENLTPFEDGITFFGPMTSPKKDKLAVDLSASIGDSQETNEKSRDSPKSLSPIKDKGRSENLLPDHINSILSVYKGVEISTRLPTVWMGSQNGYLYLHSSINDWRKCLRRVKLDDAILCIVHYKACIFIALANGTLVVFHRDSTGEWSSKGYYVLRVGKPQHSVRCLKVVADKVWCGYKNVVFVINPDSLIVEHCFTVHPRKESQIRQLAWVGDGVWCSIRLDSTLRLYHARTYVHLQDVDISPYVTQMIGTSKLGFSFVRITSLLVSLNRLWIGTGNGVIITVPFAQNEKSSSSTEGRKSDDTVKTPGGVVRVFTDPSAAPAHIGGAASLSSADQTVGSLSIPYCNMSQAQLSFHGHKDAVKFIITAHGSNKAASVQKNLESPPKSAAAEAADSSQNVEKKKLLVVSGGDGYIDFRIGDEEENVTRQPIPPKRDLSHLIVWEIRY